MGKAARARIDRQFTLEHYNQRVIALYRALASAPPRSPLGTNGGEPAYGM
jgi:hypothetical protein